MKRIFFIFVMLLAVKWNNCSLIAGDGRFEVQLDTLGGSFSLALFVPEDYDSSRAYPVAIGFHGAGMPADNMRDLIYVADSYIGSIIACPEYNDAVSGAVFFARITKTMMYISENYNLNTGRAILASFSAGAYYAFNMALNSGSFMGVIGISPALRIQSLAPTSWSNIKGSRMAMITGTADEFFPGVDSLAAEINNQGGSLKYIVKEGMGHGDDAYFNSIDFINDYTECYNYIINEANEISFDVPSGPIIKAGPNPAKDRLIVGLPGSEQSNSINNYTLMLYSLAGEKVLETKALGEQHVVISTNGISPGVYILKAVAEQKNGIQNAPHILKVVITK